ncbi:MAG: ComEC/Rec2 family competence protein, partial [Lachnospiraceae bacterium]|nr:ComEC/Rec2 family competence protein [Lachnospiraceae bacterium]
MKRPLLVLLLAVLAVVWIRILFFPGTLFFSYTKEQMHGVAEGDFLTVVGELQGAERKRTFDDTVVDVWYVRPLASSRRHQGGTALVQCIMEDGKTCQEGGMQTEETCQEGGMQRGEMCLEEDREKESCPIGMIVKVRGKLRLFSGPTNPGEFDNRLYYSTMKIAYALKDCRSLGASGRSAFIRKFLYHLRRRMDEGLTLCFSPEDGGIMKAVLLGEKSMMDSEIKDLYRRNGIIHVLAISGLHISLIGYLIYRRLCKTTLPLPLCSACAILVMVLYGLMCGMNASAVRAIIMFLCRCAAPRLHRSYDLLSALSLSAILLLLDQPLWLKNGGFLFSFFAVGGIYFVMPALS